MRKALIAAVLGLLAPAAAWASPIPLVQATDLTIPANVKDFNNLILQINAALAAGTGSIPLCSSSTPGVCQPDGTTIMAVGGVISAVGGSGNVVGPASATDTDLASYNSTTGKLIQDSGILTTNVDTLSGNQTITGNKIFNGTFSGTGVTNYLKAPANIGETTPPAVHASTLSATGAITASGLSSGTCTSGVALDSGNQLVTTSCAVGGSGNVVGPASATDTDLASYNSTTGKLIQDSGIATANVDTLSGNQTVTGNKIFSGALSGAGLTNYLKAPAAIGGTTPAAGAFTTLAASSTVSGTGFSTYLASPPAIGGTAPAAGAFTTLSATSTPTFPLTHQKVLMGNSSDAATATSLSQDIGCIDTGACTVTGLQTNKVDSGVPNNGDVLTWHTSGTPAWAPTAGGVAGVASLASGTSSLVVSGTGSGPYTGAVTITQTQPARSTAGAAIVSTDGGGAVINTSGGMTIANATGGLGDGFAAEVLAVAAATITPTTATINGNATEPLGINQGIEIFSKGGEYFAILGMPEPVASSVLVASSGRVPAWQAGTSSQLVKGDGSLGTLGTAAAVNTGTSGATIPLLNGNNTESGTNSHTGAETFAEVHGGLPETVTLTSNDYVAVAADCGKIKVLPTGTTPTVHLPNLNVGCTITFVTSVAISYQILPASGGTVWSSTGFNKTRGTAAGDTVSATITVNSASAAKWVISGDVTS